MLTLKQVCRLLLLVICLPLTAAYAEPLSSQQLNQLLNGLAELITENYVEIELANTIADELKAAADSDGISNAPSEAALAAALTQFLKNYDGHFNVVWQDPAEQPAAANETEADRQLRRERQLAALRRQNYGFQELQILEGNIGYLKLNQFSSASIPEAAQTAISAMNFLASSDTVIIDLRQNGGGDPNMVQLLTSYLFEQPTYLNALYYRPTDTTQQFWTYAKVEGRRFPDMPVYVLISGRTGSAAEEFAYNLKTRDRATLVGQTTYGGANPGGMFPVINGFSAFISTGKAINPITNTNWEGVGVKPDVDIAAEDALDWAIDDALNKLAATTDEKQHDRELSWAIEARQPPRMLTTVQANEYLGEFFGKRKVQLINEQLIYTRDNRPPQTMLAVGDDRFRLAGINGFRLTFQRDHHGQISVISENWLSGLVRPWPKQ